MPTDIWVAGAPILALRQGLRELGYVEGQNIAIEWRWAQGKNERFSDLTSELVHLKVDIIVAGTDPAVRAAQRATKTIPIVMAFPSDPVALGFVANYARPGGNITGLGLPSLDSAPLSPNQCLSRGAARLRLRGGTERRRRVARDGWRG